MRRRKKIYVVNKSSHDYSASGKFGDLEFMSEGSHNRFAVSSMWRAFEPFINESKPTDYILLTSMTIMCSVACAMFASKHHRLNLLLYHPDDMGNGRYVERIVVMEENGKENQDV